MQHVQGLCSTIISAGEAGVQTYTFKLQPCRRFCAAGGCGVSGGPQILGARSAASVDSRLGWAHSHGGPLDLDLDLGAANLEVAIACWREHRAACLCRLPWALLSIQYAVSEGELQGQVPRGGKGGKNREGEFADGACTIPGCEAWRWREPQDWWSLCLLLASLCTNRLRLACPL